MNPPIPEPTADDPLTSRRVLQLLLASPAVESFLDDTAVITEGLSPVIAGCGITVRRGTEVMSAAVSNGIAGAVDEAQYSLDDGPGLQALDTGEVAGVEDTADETRFGDYPEHALQHGVRSSFSVPLRVAGRTVAALNSYSLEAGGFDPALQERLVVLATHVEAALELTVRAAAQSEVDDQLRAAMQTRSAVDQALGIVMARRHCSASEAFATLRAGSLAAGRTIHEMAVELITTTSGEPPGPWRPAL